MKLIKWKAAFATLWVEVHYIKSLEYSNKRKVAETQQEPGLLQQEEGKGDKLQQEPGLLQQEESGGDQLQQEPGLFRHGQPPQVQLMQWTIVLFFTNFVAEFNKYMNKIKAEWDKNQ